MSETRIGFFLFEELSCYNAVFGLAKILRDRGADVTVIVRKGSKLPDYYLTQGVQATELDLDACPKAESKKTKRPVFGFSRVFRHSREFAGRAQVISRFVEEKAIDVCFVDNVRPDVNLVSSVLFGKGVSVVLLSVNFASNLGAAYPPVFSSLVPNEKKRTGLFRRSLYGVLWMWACGTEGHAVAYSLKSYLKRSAAKVLNPVKDLKYERELRRLSVHSAWGEWKRHPVLPTIFFGHRGLDWDAAASDPLRCYFGSTDIYRDAAPFDWSQLDRGRPIVFCSISTLVGVKITAEIDDLEGKRIPYGARRGFGLAMRYLNAVIDAFTRRRDWQLILACGPFYEGVGRRPLTENIYLFDRVPQLSVLNGADLVICWGGAGTVRESVNLKVPMLVFPFWTDQYGNAARVVSRNLGLSGDIRAITAETVISLTEKALGDGSIRASLEKIGFNGDGEEELGEVLGFVSSHTGITL